MLKNTNIWLTMSPRLGDGPSNFTIPGIQKTKQLCVGSFRNLTICGTDCHSIAVALDCRILESQLLESKTFFCVQNSAFWNEYFFIKFPMRCSLYFFSCCMTPLSIPNQVSFFGFLISPVSDPFPPIVRPFPPDNPQLSECCQIHIS